MTSTVLFRCMSCNRRRNGNRLIDNRCVNGNRRRNGN